MDSCAKSNSRFFIKILNGRPLSHITVWDVVDTCGVNRNTFYYYFGYVSVCA